MLRNEARWLRRELASLPIEDLSPLLSIGSGTAEFRQDRQPWIEGEVFGPFQRRGGVVVHHEHQPGAGVDLVGDLSDAAFLSSLERLDVRSVLCANVLEHLPDIEPVARALTNAVAPGGYLAVTVPRAYPYHPDPIDTMLRPSPAGLAALFPDMDCLASDEVRCGTLLAYAFSAKGKATMIRNALRFGRERRATPTVSETAAIEPSGREGWLRYVFRSTSISCAVLRRPVPRS